MRHLDEKDFAWNTLIRDRFIPENKKLDNLLKIFKE
jgi:Mg2+/Co2+ transporter CorC